MLTFTMKEPKHPSSHCTSACEPWQAKLYPTKGDKCCWNCVNCTEYEIKTFSDKCWECPLGSRPNHNKSHCKEIPQDYFRRSSPLAIVAMLFSSIGIIITSYIIAIFIKYRDTPVVKASGRELSFVLLAGILLCYSMTFIITSKPSDIICGAAKFGIGFSFSVVYAALLTKTNRIARIFRAGKRTVRRPRFISPLSQVVICWILIAIQIAIGCVWLLLSPPQAGSHFNTRADHQLVCLSAVDFSYMIGFTYPIFLIITCTAYGWITRKIPEAFNESKHIGFTMYTTCVIWLAFVPTYFSTGNNIEIRLGTMCFAINLSATICLACLFTPKFYIIILHPERNIRQSMLSSTKAQSMSKSNNSYNARVDSGTQSDGDTFDVLCQPLRMNDVHKCAL